MVREQGSVEEVEIILPGGETARFPLHGQKFGGNGASCFVIKDAGDDPDVTNGAEIHATVSLEKLSPSPHPSPTPGGGEDNVVIQGGVGIGRVTKPGLAVPVGEWAINPVPRKMIAEAIRGVFPPHPSPLTPHVTISIPNGEELSKKTLNSRLGIIGGLSILGTTGIVKPVSTQAWTDTIAAAIDVALACGCGTVVLSTGRTSELAAQRYLSYQEEAYIMMGDHVGFAVRTCARKGVRSLVLAGQFAKILKIAGAHEQTHVSSSKLDLLMLAEWLDYSPHSLRLTPYVARAGTAREVLEASGKDPELIAMVCGKAAQFVRQLAPGIRINVLLAGYGGEVLYYGPHSR